MDCIRWVMHTAVVEEVVHAGLYYAKNSLKAKACVRGRNMLSDYAKSRNVPFVQCGKLVVATSPEQVPTLHGIMEHAMENGVNNVKIISSEDVQSLESEVQCVKALLSPSTGENPTRCVVVIRYS